VMRDTLGAELVESVDPMYPDDPTVPNMKYTFQQALRDPAAQCPGVFLERNGLRRIGVRRTWLGRDDR